jgi:hypothetical protein
MKKNRIATGILTGALLLMGLMITTSTANAQHIGVGVTFGPGYYPPPPVAYAPPPVAYAPPVAPYPGYVWTNGYYNPYGVWVAGFWGPRYGYGNFYGHGFVAGHGYAAGHAYVGGRAFVGSRGFAAGRSFAAGHGGGHR